MIRDSMADDLSHGEHISAATVSALQLSESVRSYGAE